MSKKIMLFTIFILSSFALYAEGSAEVSVYTMPGCGRCAYTVDYLKKNNIPYSEYSTSDRESNIKMWGAISKSGKSAGRGISMPVVVINDQTYFNIPDLKGFAESMQSLLAAGGKVEPAQEKKDPAPEKENETEKVIPEETQSIEFFVKNKKFTYSAGTGGSITTGTATVRTIKGNEITLDVNSSKKVLINGKYRFGQASVKSVYTIILKDGAFNYIPQSGIRYTGKIDNSNVRLTMIPDSGDESSFNLDVK